MKGKKVSQQGDPNKNFLEQYKQVYALYNQATRLIKEDNLDSAELILQEIFNGNKTLQIPIEIYKTYILLLLTNEKQKQAQQFLASAPDEIKYAGEILQIQKKYNLTLIEKSAKENKFFSRKVVFSLIGLAAISFISYGIIQADLFKQSTKENENTDKVSMLQNQIKDLRNKNKTMEMKVNEAQRKLTEVKPVVSNKVEQESQQYDVNSKLYSLKPETVVKQSVNAYEKGFKYFQNKKYKQAVELFKTSYTLDSTNYSSDDTLYYLILAEQKMNNKANVNPYLTEFLNQTNSFFKSSPYYDDVLLMHAESLIREHKKEDAEKILIGIVDKYRKEWTANKAERLLKALK
ncbi:tol-pal system YbgF family protein [Bacillus sp. EAC]|uniref:tetratricopeptide repeat protein n=1 Tax=Bacillus sp. EAC TaxID=1978338 RepID=UPI000B44451B|nr:hypothetical protein [Bacillus sp. EAC]